MIDWNDLETKILEVSKELYKRRPFKRETHDIDQQVLRAVVYTQSCARRPKWNITFHGVSLKKKLIQTVLEIEG